MKAIVENAITTTHETIRATARPMAVRTPGEWNVNIFNRLAIDLEIK